MRVQDSDDFLDRVLMSLPDGGDENAAPPARPEPVPAEKLVGTWVCDRGANGKVTFTMAADGNYTWNYMKGDQKNRTQGHLQPQ